MVVILQKAFREAAWARSTALRTCRHLFYLPISLDLPTCFRCNCQTQLMSFILWYRGDKITHFPLRLAVAEITQGHISKVKFKTSRAPLLELLSPIWDAFGGAQRLCQNSSTTLSPAAKEGACEHSKTSRPGFPRMSGAEQAREEVVVPPAEAWSCWQLWDNSTFSCCQWSWKPTVLNRARPLPPQPQVEVSLVQREGWTWKKKLFWALLWKANKFALWYFHLPRETDGGGWTCQNQL